MILRRGGGRQNVPDPWGITTEQVHILYGAAVHTRKVAELRTGISVLTRSSVRQRKGRGGLQYTQVPSTSFAKLVAFVYY